MTWRWSVRGNQVRAQNGAVVTFKYDVMNVAEVQGVLVVILDVPAGCVMTENVFGVSRDGQLLWQIRPCADNAVDPWSIYTDFTGQQGPTVRIYNWIGTSNVVDARSGKVLSTAFAE